MKNENNTGVADGSVLSVETSECGFECVVAVRIKINEAFLELKPGTYSGRQIKELAQIPLAYELEILHGKELVPVPDGRFVRVKGCEKFVSFPCRGKSS